MSFAAKTFTAWRFRPEELLLIKVDKPRSYALGPRLTHRTIPDEPERWCIDLTILAKKHGVLFYEPFELDSRPGHDFGCVSFLTCAEDYVHWAKAGAALNATIYRLDKRVQAGCYGLIELLGDGEFLYWSNASRHLHARFLAEMVDEPLNYRGAEASVYEAFAAAQVIAGDKPSHLSTTFSAQPWAPSLLQTIKETLEQTGWDDAKADIYSTRQYNVPHWDELEEEEAKNFLNLLQNVLLSRSKIERSQS